MVEQQSFSLPCVLCIPIGFVRRDGMVEALANGPHVGVCHCLGLVTDGIGTIQVQCCWVKPKDNEGLIMTGNLSSVTKDAIPVMKDLVIASTRAIASRLGLPPDELSLDKRGHDLHVHVEHRFLPIETTYLMGAIYVSLVSLMIGRQPGDDTMVFGHVGNSSGSFSSKWKLDETNISNCKYIGYRRAILGKNTEVTDGAKAAAEMVQDDGKPLVELIIVEDILDAISLCFSRE